jgi:hypothetical protein
MALLFTPDVARPFVFLTQTTPVLTDTDLLREFVGREEKSLAAFSAANALPYCGVDIFSLGSKNKFLSAAAIAAEGVR